MPLDLFALTFDANDPRCLADFWAEVLGRTETDDHGDGVALLPTDDTGFRLRFVPNRYAKTWVSNRAHFDLTSTSVEDQQARHMLVLNAEAAAKAHLASLPPLPEMVRDDLMQAMAR